MAFIINQTKKAVNSLEVDFKDGSKVTFYFRKATTKEILEAELAIDSFNNSYTKLIESIVPLYDRYNALKSTLDDLSALDDETATDEDKARAEAAGEEVRSLMKELNKANKFEDPASLDTVKELIRNFIVKSEGIQDVDGTEYNFPDLPANNQDEVLDNIPLESLKHMVEKIKESVSLSPLG